MRHHRRTKRLVRTKSHREALLTNMALSVFKHQRIRTTKRRAKEASRFIDKLITIGKTSGLPARRKAFDVLRDRTAVFNLFNKVAPLFKDRAGGYTRILPLAQRRMGDGAEMVFLELVEKFAIPERKKAKSQKKPEKEQKPEKEPKGQQPAEGAQKPPEEQKLPPVKKAPPKVIEVDKGKARSEQDKLRKGFLKGIRGMFRGRSGKGE